MFSEIRREMKYCIYCNEVHEVTVAIYGTGRENIDSIIEQLYCRRKNLIIYKCGREKK